MDAGRVGDAQAGAKVARVGDAVEDEQEGRLLERVEDVVEVGDLARRTASCSSTMRSATVPSVAT